MMDRTPVRLGIIWMALAMAATGQTTVTNSNNGSTNTIHVYTGSATLGNSPVSASGSNVGPGTTSPTAKREVSRERATTDFRSSWVNDS